MSHGLIVDVWGPRRRRRPELSSDNQEGQTTMGDAVFGQVNYKVMRSDYRGNDRYAQLQDELNRYGRGGARVVYANIEEGGVNTGSSTPDPKITVTLILMAEGPTS